MARQEVSNDKSTQLRICQIMLSKGFGGAERLFTDLVISLDRLGHDVLPICHPQSKARELLEAAGIECVGVSTLGWWDPVAPLRIRSWLNKYKPDVVHTHLARATYLTARAGTAIPFIASLHNYGKSRYYYKADWYLPITDDGARHLQEMGVRSDRIRVIPNFSRLPVVSHLPREKHQPPILLAYGRFVEKKGFADLLAALALVKSRGIDFRLRLGGAGELELQLKQQCEREGLAANVTFIGWLDDVISELDQSDMFILPSRSEPFGIVVLEAMARGIPVITTQTEGPREFLSSETAWLTPIADVGALADVIIEALSRPNQRITRAEAALSLYNNHYSADRVVPRIVEFYETAAVGGAA